MSATSALYLGFVASWSLSFLPFVELYIELFQTGTVNFSRDWTGPLIIFAAVYVGQIVIAAILWGLSGWAFTWVDL